MAEVPVPFDVALHAGFEAFASQIHANHVFISDIAAVVVVAAEACTPLVVDAETAHWCGVVSQFGATFEFGVGVADVLQMRR